jgi:hypothetical protein
MYTVLKELALEELDSRPQDACGSSLLGLESGKLLTDMPTMHFSSMANRTAAAAAHSAAAAERWHRLEPPSHTRLEPIGYAVIPFSAGRAAVGLASPLCACSASH